MLSTYNFPNLNDGIHIAGVQFGFDSQLDAEYW